MINKVLLGSYKKDNLTNPKCFINWYFMFTWHNYSNNRKTFKNFLIFKINEFYIRYFFWKNFLKETFINMTIPPPFNLQNDLNFFTKLKYELVRPSKKITYLAAFCLQFLRIIYDSFFKIGSKEYVFIWDIRNNAITFERF